ncbi:FACE1 [Symbiodinium sp. CCMP2456]|nr:FACE1 [Symbiodinium sp. CCMP2456]
MDRLQSSGYGYGPLSEMQKSSVRLPVNPLPVDALNPFQAPSDQTIKKVTALETSMMEIKRRLDDWTEVTRQGIADLRAEIGAVKLEQRFSQTLRNAPNEGDALNGLRQDATTGTPLEGGKQTEDVGEDLKHRFEVFEEKLSAIHSEHMLDTTSIRERLEAALQQSDSQTSRADELQALLKEEEGRRTLLFVRLEAVEASLQDLRTNQRDMASANEVTERVLKGELKKEASGMLQELDVRLKALESSAIATDTVAADQSNAAADLGEIRASLLSSTNDILRLAKEVATIREEHDQAIGDLGSLTERVAKSAIAGIQRSEVELSQLILARVEPRVASLEAKMGGTQAEDLMESTETGIMGATRHVAETSSSEVKPSWVAQDERKSQGEGPDNLRQGVKDKLQGITNAVQQVLGALESGEKVGETRPPGNLDKQRTQESLQPTSARVAEARDFWQGPLGRLQEEDGALQEVSRACPLALSPRGPGLAPDRPVSPERAVAGSGLASLGLSGHGTGHGRSSRPRAFAPVSWDKSPTTSTENLLSHSLPFGPSGGTRPTASLPAGYREIPGADSARCQLSAGIPLAQAHPAASPARPSVVQPWHVLTASRTLPTKAPINGCRNSLTQGLRTRQAL